MTEYTRGLMHEPTQQPERPFFSSGPCAKFPGWSLDKLKTESLGRSHRSALGKARLKYAIDLSRELLGIPDDYLIGIMPASDTGAIEAAVDAIIAANADKVEQYRGGKEALFGFFVGQTMKAMQGKANPGVVNALLKDKLG